MQAGIVKLLLVFSLSILACSPACAGSQQYSGESKFSTEQLAEFAKQVEKVAGAKGARALIVGRLGTPQSELPERIQFTHVGLAIYSRIDTSEGKTLYGYAIHNLYQNPNDLDHSSLVTDYPIDFFAGAVELKAGIIIPKRELQIRLIAAIESGANKRLHNVNYSIVSNPYSLKFQNCTEHLLDMIFASIYQTEDRQQIKVNEQTYFTAQSIKLSPLKRLLAPLVSDGINMSDHPAQIKTATFTTIADFLTNYGLVESVMVLDENGPRINSP
jgi:hypothetical protein